MDVGNQPNNPDNDGTNSCSFLALEIATDIWYNEKEKLKQRVEYIIENLQLTANPRRDIDQLYDSTEALSILKKVKRDHKYSFEFRELIFPADSLLSPDGVCSLPDALHQIANRAPNAVIYICETHQCRIQRVFEYSVYMIHKILFVKKRRPKEPRAEPWCGARGQSPGKIYVFDLDRNP